MTENIFDNNRRFILKDYKNQKPFTNFLPGIAGFEGIPMWVFYVNRGQAITSFGIGSKDQSIMEFYPANKAYRNNSQLGFRTFIKLKSNNLIIQPFSNNISAPATMYIGRDEVEIEQVIEDHKLQINVLYYTLPNENFAGLIRKITITNLSERNKEIEIIDGMPVIVSSGVTNDTMKQMTRTAEAWMEVFELENGTPFYRVRSSMSDFAKVDDIKSGNFAISFTRNQDKISKQHPIVDPTIIFDQDTSFTNPINFINQTYDQLRKKKQRTVGQLPSAFFIDSISIKANNKVEIYTLIGNLDDESKLSETTSIITPEFLDQKLVETRELSREITSVIETETSNPQFDAYLKQTYLDNVLRGGMPIKLSKNSPPYHVYSRKHGDPERDYNFFYLAPEIYSQGNGNYRDVNQNRRNDIYFYPQVESYNLKFFLSLIQLDGYNPLIVKGLIFHLDENDYINLLHENPKLVKIDYVLKKTFTPGSLKNSLLKNKIHDDKLFKQIMDLAKPIIDVEHGEGFWTDHWTYNIDLLETFLAIYPDKIQKEIFEDHDIPWFKNYTQVLPRTKRYQVTEEGLRQYQSVLENENLLNEMNQKGINAKWEKIHSSAFEKLLFLVLIKLLTLDPSGTGVEMEAGKPGWYDALNGMPGLLGSSVSESFEVIRLSRLLAKLLKEISDDILISLPIEIGQLLLDLISLIENKGISNIEFWNQSNQIKESYRERIYQEVSGDKKDYTKQKITEYLNKIVNFLDQLENKITSTNTDLAPTYFHFEADIKQNDFLITEETIRKLTFERIDMPLFLEGIVHQLRIANKKEAQNIYKKIRKSPLFDKKLKMYKVNASLLSKNNKIGRAYAFPSGWLENESIWLHMEYKYLLELLRNELYEQFFEDIQNAFIPFQPVERYGRSPLENSSFITSSAFPVEDLHGNGFVARLSGSTAELLTIWFEMFVGTNPFKVKNDKLILEFKPKLPDWLFNQNDEISFMFLGKTKVIYHNPHKINTWNAKIKKINIAFPDLNIDIDSNIIPSTYAKDIRDGLIKKIYIELGNKNEK